MLSGIRVLDLSRVLAGPFCSQILGDLGATVIKVERPRFGDDTREWKPPIGPNKVSAYFNSTNRNKKSITVDITKSRGQDIIKKLAKDSQCFIENFQAKKLAKYSLDYDNIKKINEEIIYLSITGYGSGSSRPGYDFIVQGESGIMSITGDPDSHPMKVGVAISDVVTGLYGTIGILSSLVSQLQKKQQQQQQQQQQRNMTSIYGEHIDLSLFDCSLSYLVNQGMNYLSTGETPQRLGNKHPNICPYETFQGKNGTHLILAIGNDKQFRDLCDLLNFNQNERILIEEKFKTNPERVQNRDELSKMLQEKLILKEAKEWLSEMMKHGIPAGSVNTIKQALQEPQVKDRNMVWEDKKTGMKVIGNPLKFKNNSNAIKYDFDTPPQLGYHTEEVLREYLGMETEEIESLKADKII